MDPAVDASLSKWHAMIARRDLTRLPDILAPQCVFRSPVAFHPYQGAASTARILAAAATVFEDFTYHRQFHSGRDVALEFSARVGAVQLKGIDLLRFDEAGRIVEFEVMVRPASGLQALGHAMAAQLAAGA